MSQKIFVLIATALLATLVSIPASADQITLGASNPGTTIDFAAGGGGINITGTNLAGSGLLQIGASSTVLTYVFSIVGTPHLNPIGSGNFSMPFVPGNQLNTTFTIGSSTLTGWWAFSVIKDNTSIPQFDGPGIFHVTAESGTAFSAFSVGGDYLADFTLSGVNPTLDAILDTGGETSGALSSGEIQIPEPATMVLLGSGLLGLATGFRRKMK
ncbi:MAG TPA: PEP-CTERM sorting domain-containing protein [Terriglobales bacterium]|nr:PEP-CTERM sorting domain-containing protein [Terriglobales bacterium]